MKKLMAMSQSLIGKILLDDESVDLEEVTESQSLIGKILPVMTYFLKNTKH